MKQRILFIIWGVLYGICAGLGFVANPTDAQSVAMTILSLCFFVPGALLLADAISRKSRKLLLTLRIISVVSLILTIVVFIANLASAAASEAVGNALYYALILVSAPMVSMGYELLSLFLWACLLISTIVARKTIKD